MPSWRPRQLIRVIAIGLHWRGDRLLMAEVADDAGRITGHRPLGGGLEFGERWHDALRREFREELGVAVDIAGPPLVLENIYVHHGQTGHEIVFAADVTFPPGAFDGQEAIVFREDNGVAGTARWLNPRDLSQGGPALFPEGLRAALDARATAG